MRSLDRISVFFSTRWNAIIHRPVKGCPLKPKKTGKLFYQYVTLSALDVRKNVTIHVAVCEAFHGKRPAGHEAAHWNDDKDDNRADNLRWATPVQNADDKRRNGNLNSGDRNGHAKLEESHIREIRQVYTPRRRSELAKKYGVTPSCIYQAASRRTWKHVA
ncbi:HNH endonuclease signature motif containing protein [Paraburkholderia fungorum]|uniref:HNH endonuclease signature motif containing protein n=1 Tax=Paraburkholderia fungorum TaxID=134537 RepID=UPI003D6C635C